MDDQTHTPVLLKETLEVLRPRSGGLYIDATVGLGGHAEAILQASEPDGRLIGIDQDPEAVEFARTRLAEFGERARVVHLNFSELATLTDAADGILMDLGMSSAQLERSGRGFSFLRDEPLDMRMNPETSETAANVLNRYPQGRLEEILRVYGEERRARQLAAAIARRRKRERYRTTSQLVETVGSDPRHKSRIHPATRVFQALRIAVNDELGRLVVGLEAALGRLSEGGTLCVISFHSLEDRIVKRRFRETARADERFETLTKKPLEPSDEERARNPRARSAKLRAIRRGTT